MLWYITSVFRSARLAFEAAASALVGALNVFDTVVVSSLMAVKASTNALPVHEFEHCKTKKCSLAHAPFSDSNYVGGQWAAGDELLSFIVFPKDVIIAKPRGIEDLIAWILIHDWHEKALALVANTWELFDEVGSRYYDYLIVEKKYGDTAYDVALMALATNPLFHKDLLIRRSTPFSFTYACEKNGGYLMDIVAELDKFVWTYYNFYHSTPTKLAEETYFFRFWQDMSVGIISFITAEDVPQDAIVPCVAGLLRVVVQKLQETVGLFADVGLQITTTNSGATALMLCVKFEQGTNLRDGAYFGMVNIFIVTLQV